MDVHRHNAYPQNLALTPYNPPSSEPGVLETREFDEFQQQQPPFVPRTTQAPPHYHIPQQDMINSRHYNHGHLPLGHESENLQHPQAYPQSQFRQAAAAHEDENWKDVNAGRVPTLEELRWRDLYRNVPARGMYKI